ncbi:MULTISPECIES: hypothetical protein [unclassified Streptomyces]|nr:hypothetical protein OG452_19590 [Streptomyces sp. NBC_01197]WSS49951.1 hypothetical protein OG708_15665 [Streptomyces sp. NBC_01180]
MPSILLPRRTWPVRAKGIQGIGYTAADKILDELRTDLTKR